MRPRVPELPDNRFHPGGNVTTSATNVSEAPYVFPNDPVLPRAEGQKNRNGASVKNAIVELCLSRSTVFAEASTSSESWNQRHRETLRTRGGTGAGLARHPGRPQNRQTVQDGNTLEKWRYVSGLERQPTGLRISGGK